MSNHRCLLFICVSSMILSIWIYRWGNTPLDESRRSGSKPLITLLENAKSSQLSEIHISSHEILGNIILLYAISMVSDCHILFFPYCAIPSLSLSEQRQGKYIYDLAFKNPCNRPTYINPTHLYMLHYSFKIYSDLSVTHYWIHHM